MLIKIDARETDLFQSCKLYLEQNPKITDVELITESLPLGDIIILDKETEYLIIERKKVNDLAASIKDGRYEEQSYRLNGISHHNHNIIYLVEGDINKYNNKFKDRISKSTLYSAMFSLNYYKGFSVWRSISLDESASMLCIAANKLNKEKDSKNAYYNTSTAAVPTKSNDTQVEAAPTEYCNVVKRIKKDNITPENIGEIMLTTIPGISSVTAIAIMLHFKTLNNLLAQLKENSQCLKEVCYMNAKSQSKKLNKTCIENINKYLNS